MKYIAALIICCSTFFAFGQAKGATQSQCSTKVLDTGSVEGIFRGITPKEYYYAAVELSTGEMFMIIADEDKVKKSLGSGTGQQVSVQYDLMQFWNESRKSCQRSEVFKSGKILAAAPAQSAQATQQTPVTAAQADFVGKWQRTNISKEYPGAIEITNKTSESFDFQFNGYAGIGAGINMGEIEGTAKFVSPAQAIFILQEDHCKAAVLFELQEYLHVKADNNTCFGFGWRVFIDGEYTKWKPKYEE